jgi:hypothetical protein
MRRRVHARLVENSPLIIDIAHELKVRKAVRLGGWGGQQS